MRRCGTCGATTFVRNNNALTCTMVAEHDATKLYTVRAQDMARLGYKQVGKATRWVGPEGESYVRCLMGNPSLAIVNLDGSKCYLSLVPQHRSRTP